MWWRDCGAARWKHLVVTRRPLHNLFPLVLAATTHQKVQVKGAIGMRLLETRGPYDSPLALLVALYHHLSVGCSVEVAGLLHILSGHRLSRGLDHHKRIDTLTLNSTTPLWGATQLQPRGCSRWVNALKTFKFELRMAMN